MSKTVPSELTKQKLFFCVRHKNNVGRHLPVQICIGMSLQLPGFLSETAEEILAGLHGRLWTAGQGDSEVSYQVH